jgi:hypothetical protein
MRIRMVISSGSDEDEDSTHPWLEILARGPKTCATEGDGNFYDKRRRTIEEVQPRSNDLWASLYYICFDRGTFPTNLRHLVFKFLVHTPALEAVSFIPRSKTGESTLCLIPRAHWSIVGTHFALRPFQNFLSPALCQALAERINRKHGSHHARVQECSFLRKKVLQYYECSAKNTSVVTIHVLLMLILGTS